jgi:DNA-binding FrmR family transcriptional regulator
MSENEVGEIMRALGRIEGQIDGLPDMRDGVQTIKHEIASVKYGLTALNDEVQALKARGCAIGADNRRTLNDLAGKVAFLEGIWKKAVLVMAGVGVGAVGVKESLAAILNMIGGV